MTVLAVMTNSLSWTFSGGATTSIASRTLSNPVDAFDPSAVVTCTLTGDYRLYNLSDDTITHRAVILGPGLKVMAAADSGGTPVVVMSVGPNDSSRTTGATLTTMWTAPIDFPYVDTTASEADWDAAVLTVYQDYDNNMGGDGGYFSIPANAWTITLANSNRDVICTTATVTVGTKPASWSRTAAASNDFSWTPGSGQTLHVIPLAAPTYTMSTLGWWFNTGSSTTPNSQSPTVVKKNVTVLGGFAIDAPAGNLTVSSNSEVVVYEADNDLDLGAAGGYYLLPYAAWSTTSNYIATEDLRAGQSFGTTTSLLMPGGTPSSALRDYNQYYNGTSWASETALLNACYDHAACGSYSAGVVIAGVVSGGVGAITQEWGGTSWSTGGATLTNLRDHDGSGTATDCMYMGGNVSGATAATATYNGTAWTSGTDMNTARYLGDSSCGVSTSDIMVYGGYTGAVILDVTESWNGSTWTDEATMLWTWYYGGAAGSGQADAAAFMGVRNGSTLSDTHARYDGVAWANSDSPSFSRTDTLSGGISTGDMFACGRNGAGARNASLYQSGPSAFEHTAANSGNWVAATVKIEIDQPRTVTCTSAVVTITGSQASVGLKIFGASAPITVTGNDALVIQGDASYPVSFSTTGVITGTTAVINITGTPATVTQDRPVTGSTETVVVTGNTATVTKDVFRTITGTTETIAVVGNTATIFKGVNRSVTCTPASVLISGSSSVQRDRLVGGLTESIALVGQPAQVFKGLDRDVNCTPESIVITGFGAVNQARPVSGSGAVTVAGEPATVRKDRLSVGATEAITITGTPATVTKQIIRAVNCTPATINFRGVSGGLPFMSWFRDTRQHFPAQLIHGEIEQSLSASSNDAAELFLLGPGTWNDAVAMVFTGGQHLSRTLFGYNEAGSWTKVGDWYYTNKKPLKGFSTLRADGTDAYVYKSLVTGLDNEASFVMYGYFNADNTTGSKTLMTTRVLNPGSSGGTELVLDGNVLNLYAYDTTNTLTTDSSGVSNTYTITAGEWFFVVWGLNTNTGRYYINVALGDGLVQADKDFPKGGNSGGSGFVPVRIGRGTNSAPQIFQGYIGDFGVSPTRTAGASVDGPKPEYSTAYYQNNAFANRQWLEAGSWDTASFSFQADMGGWCNNRVSVNAGLANTDWNELHRLTSSWTIEVTCKVTDNASSQIIFDTTNGSGLAAGVRLTLNADESLTLYVARFNDTACANVSTAAAAFTYGVRQDIAVSYNISTNTFRIRLNGSIVATDTTTNPPDTVSNANTDLTFFTTQAQVHRDIRITYSDIYGVDNYTPTPQLQRWLSVVRKDRLVECTSALIDVTGQPGTIISNPTRNVNCTPGVVTITGTQATVSKDTSQPRDVVCTTAVVSVFGTAATVVKGRDWQAVPETVLITGQAATIRKDRDVTGSNGSVLITGTPALVTKGVDRDVVGQTETIIISASGQVDRGRTVDGQTETIVVASNPATITKTRLVQGVTSDVLITANPAEISKTRDVTSQSASILVSGTPATPTLDREIICQTANIVVSSSGAAFQHRDVLATSGQLVVHATKGEVIKGLFGVIICEPMEIIVTAQRAYVSKMTIQNPLPRYDRLGVSILPPEADTNLLLTADDGVRVLLGVGILNGLESPDIV